MNMRNLIIKRGAAGDVVRTTTLLSVLDGTVDWLVSDGNAALVDGVPGVTRTVRWSDRAQLGGEHYDVVINLEDDRESSDVLTTVTYERLFGAHWSEPQRRMTYTPDASAWFDMSMISRFGKAAADALKLKNRRSYQELLLEGLGRRFSGQPYRLPPFPASGLAGDVALAPKAGAVWPMKNWYGFDALAGCLRDQGLVVNILPQRESLLAHLADVAGHRCLVSGDSLPMHLALGAGRPCVSIFTCTSPWEIYPYGLQRQLISPRLAQYFYRRDFDAAATRTISLDEVRAAVAACLG